MIDVNGIAAYRTQRRRQPRLLPSPAARDVRHAHSAPTRGSTNGASACNIFCFRLRSREDVDTLHASMRDFAAKVIRAGEEGPWAPGFASRISR